MNLDESSPTTPDARARVHSTRESDSAFFAAFDEQRATVLRKRIQWYCILASALLSLSVLGDAMTLATVGTLSAQNWLRSGTLLVMIGLYVFALVYLARATPGRERLVEVLTALTCVVLFTSMFSEVVVYWADSRGPTTAEELREALQTMGFRVTFAFGFLFALACVLVPMTVRESGRIALVGLGTFAVILVGLVRPPTGTTLVLVGLFVVFAAPGMAWSWWRFREFDARFRADALLVKYQNLRGEAREISAELSQARRLHEALFPRPITAGALRVGYAYEPMREIGGDFLFVHREPASAGADGKGGDAAITLVLLDVSGHGIPAALSVNRLHGELLRFFSNYPHATGEAGRPGHVLANLNTYACAALSPQGVFATALVVRCCPTARTLEYASAGHPTAFVRRADGGVTELASTATMLGVLDSDTFHPDARELNLHPGDRVVAYTDGAMETRDAAGTDFSAARIREMAVATALPEKPGTGRLAPIADAIMAAVNSHRHGPVQDDTLVVELSHTGAALRPAVRERTEDDLTQSRV